MSPTKIEAKILMIVENRKGSYSEAKAINKKGEETPLKPGKLTTLEPGERIDVSDEYGVVTIFDHTHNVKVTRTSQTVAEPDPRKGVVDIEIREAGTGITTGDKAPINIIHSRRQIPDLIDSPARVFVRGVKVMEVSWGEDL